MAAVQRRVARVLVIDDVDRILLLKGADPARPQFPIWHAPGGGVDVGETASGAARRELQEEIGLCCEELGEVVWTRRLDFSWDGIQYDQHEVYFVHRLGSHEVDGQGRSPTERRYLSDHGWFTVDNLRSVTDLLAPPDLPDRLHDLLMYGSPTSPVEVRGAVLP